MPTIEENLNFSNEWRQSGDAWSIPWGGTDIEWYSMIFPRICAFVPAGTILEIGPGHGRWTKFLANLCKDLILVDLSDECIKVCKEIFKPYSHITYYTNDGKSLDMIADASLDFVFSFDSLVHAEEDVIEAYLSQLSKKMKRNSIGFIHHSNIGAYKISFGLSRKIIKGRIRNILIKLGIIEDKDHWRAHSMTAAKFKKYAEKAGLKCISQELITWSTKRLLIDCISVCAREDSGFASRGVVENRAFMKEARYFARLSKFYGR
jgi:SAM-dependent methyltransferase